MLDAGGKLLGQLHDFRMAGITGGYILTPTRFLEGGGEPGDDGLAGRVLRREKPACFQCEAPRAECREEAPVSLYGHDHRQEKNPAKCRVKWEETAGSEEDQLGQIPLAIDPSAPRVGMHSARSLQKTIPHKCSRQNNRVVKRLGLSVTVEMAQKIYRACYALNSLSMAFDNSAEACE